MSTRSVIGQAFQDTVDQQYYTKRSERFQLEVDKLDNDIRMYSLLRIAVALAFVVVGYFAFSHHLLFFGLPVLLTVFFALVKMQLKKEEERSVLRHLVNLNQWEVNALNFDFSKFPTGEGFINPTHPFTHDLDIFGKGSLFQYINRSATHLGEIKLAQGLSYPAFHKAEVLHRQEAIRELAPRVEFRQQCWATGKQINDANVRLDSLLGWLHEPNLFYDREIYSIIKWILPVVTCSSLVAIYFDSIFQPVFVLLMMVQLAIAAIHNKQISQLQSSLSSYRTILENYARIFQLMKSETFTSTIMKKQLDISVAASDNVKQFSVLVNSVESRMNLIARVFGNGLFLYDFHSVSNLEQWRHQHAKELPHWLESLAEWDALLSFATLHFNQPTFAFAEVSEQLSISSTGLGHPLIPSLHRVVNDFDLGEPANVLLITGANMAGKSTFLRAIGVNYILAINGSPVCASHWRGPLVELRTGMRTSDSLQENQSYFFAELNRLQSIIQELRNAKPMIILLDEILKGTNSTDKQTGSRELIKQLMAQKALVVIATHDIALGDLEQRYPDRVSNACFEGNIQNDKLTFNYTLNKGVATKANATFLMRKMGIIP